MFNFNKPKNKDSQSNTQSAPDYLGFQPAEPAVKPYEPQHVAPTPEASSNMSIGEKIKQNPVYRGLAVGFATLAVGGILAGMAYNTASTPVHRLEELNNSTEYKTHGAAKITIGEGGAQLQVARTDVDGRAGITMVNVGKLKEGAEFEVKHYETTALESSQAIENASKTKTYTFLRDDLPKEVMELDGIVPSPEPFFQVVNNENHPSIDVTDIE